MHLSNQNVVQHDNRSTHCRWYTANMPLLSTRCPCSSSAACTTPQQQARLPRHIKAFAAGRHQNNFLQSQHEATHTAAALSRRDALLLASTAAAANLLGAPGQVQPAQAANTISQLSEATTTSSISTVSSSTPDLQLYENTKQQYRMQVPAAWERKEKAGADVLFEDPERRSTSVGVTVSPVRVATIGQFGDLAAVGQRLLEAERKKESTLDVQLLTSSERQGSNGAVLYDYEYELDSTRGKKRIFNTVTITGSKLYILNGNFKCHKEAGCGAGDAAPPLTLLRQIAGSFDAGSS